MSEPQRRSGPFDSVAYWTKRLLLGLFGPATQDRESDPVERLKREYGRKPAP